MSLFSAFELTDLDDSRSGYRLQRLEWLNWGTFDGAIAGLDLDGHNTLLTGDIGSGKSTIVDAITTLLLRADRIAYNKAAGAESRERDLRSYVLGHWKAERSEETGRTRPVALRGDTSYSVLLAVFANEQLGQVVTLAQVFWMAGSTSNQPQRFYAVHAGERLSIAKDFADFGPQVAALKKRLRGLGAGVFDTFPDYEKQYRRALGIPGAQAMELFHQTVSMKSVGDLNEFVRSHMLEPFDAAASVRKLIGHFDDLTAAHDAVVKAKAQLARLDPLVKTCDDHARASQEAHDLHVVRGVLRAVADRVKRRLLAAEHDRLATEIQTGETRLTTATRQLESLRDRQQGLREVRAGLGGGRLGYLEDLLPSRERERDQRQAAASRLNVHLADAGLDPVGSAAELPRRLAEVHEALGRAATNEATLREQQTSQEADRRELGVRSRRINDELVSLRARRSNVPKEFIDLRERLCTATGLDEDELPFVGELVQVRADERRWQGAAERVLRGFGLSLAVQEQHYAIVSSWINDNHLGARLVYLRVRDSRSRRGGAPLSSRHDLPPDAEPLFDKLEVSDTALRGWVTAELHRRADHACVESMSQFRRLDRAVTLTGQVKSGDRHEKDDRRRVDDPSNYILGWSNAQKVDALVEQATAVHRDQTRCAEQAAVTATALEVCTRHRSALDKATTVTDPDQVDWWSVVTEIDALEREKRHLEASSTELAQLTAELDAVEGEIEQAQRAEHQIIATLGSLRDRFGRAGGEIERLDEAFIGQAEPDPDLAAAAQKRLGDVREPADCDRAVASASEELAEQERIVGDRIRRAENAAVRLMGDFRREYPAETSELDDSIHSAGEYRQLRDRVASDDLPRFEADFKKALNTETIREIATFSAQLRRQQDTIKRRIDTINDSLRAIDYNEAEQTYIELEARETPNVNVREFRQSLRECTSNVTTGDDEQYSESKFAQVVKLIERFKGRDGFAEHDRRWTREVTDVRNWFVFGGSERYRADNSVRESFADSDGKSGGQKEKLAYTILAASLAYQFKLDPGAAESRTFRFAVIDEAFGRGSDVSTRYALELFGKFGLQLLVVTPLQKVQVIEPYVMRVGFVANPSGNASRLLTMTIGEYRENKQAFASAGMTIDPP